METFLSGADLKRSSDVLGGCAHHCALLLSLQPATCCSNAARPFFLTGAGMKRSLDAFGRSSDAPSLKRPTVPAPAPVPASVTHGSDYSLEDAQVGEEAPWQGSEGQRPGVGMRGMECTKCWRCGTLAMHGSDYSLEDTQAGGGQKQVFAV